MPDFESANSDSAFRDPSFDGELLRHGDRIRSVAGSLVRDHALAEDIAQDTWVHALSRPPAHRGRLAGWVGRVVRTTLYQERRATRRREVREEGSVRCFSSEPLSAEREAERREILEVVRDSVDELREPYRTVIVMRHFEGMPPREIAVQLGVPVKTVKTRLERAHAELREKLGRRKGVSAFASLLALFRRPTPTSGLRVSVVVGAAAVVIVSVSVFLFRGESSDSVMDSTSGLTSAVRAPVRAGEIHAERSAQTSAPAMERAANPDADTADGSVVSTSSAVATVTGRVIDLDGGVIPGATVHYTVIDHPVRLGVGVEMRAWVNDAIERGDSLSTLADQRGRFDLALSSPPPERVSRVSYGGTPLLRVSASGEQDHRIAVVTATAPGRTAVLIAAVGRSDRGMVDGPDSEGLTIVMAPRVRFSASVWVGSTLATRATLSWAPPESLRSRVGTALVDGIPLTWRHVSGADGAFADAEVPAVPGAVLFAAASGVSKSFPTPMASGESLQLHLDEPAVLSKEVVSARLLTPDGAPATWGAVTDGYRVARPDPEGWFSWPAPMAGDPPLELKAVAAGFVPFEIPLQSSRALDGAELRFDGESRHFRGRVVDGSGHGVPGVRVDLGRLTPLWDGPIESPVCMEHVLAPPSAGEEGGEAADVFAMTDESGAFCIEGLLDREYELVATQSGDGRVARRRLRPSDVPVRLDWPGPTRQTEELMVRDRMAVPVAGASVRVERCVSVLPRPAGPAAEVTRLVFSGVTDQSGRVRFACEDMDGVTIHVEAPAFLAQELSWVATAKTSTSDRHRVVLLDRAAFLRVDGGAIVPAAESFTLHDEAGEPVFSHYQRGGWIQRVSEVKLFDGCSEVIAAPTNARSIRIRYGDRIDERGITLTPGEIERITL